MRKDQYLNDWKKVFFGQIFLCRDKRRLRPFYCCLKNTKSFFSSNHTKLFCSLKCALKAGNLARKIKIFQTSRWPPVSRHCASHQQKRPVEVSACERQRKRRIAIFDFYPWCFICCFFRPQRSWFSDSGSRSDGQLPNSEKSSRHTQKSSKLFSSFLNWVLTRIFAEMCSLTQFLKCAD